MNIPLTFSLNHPNYAQMSLPDPDLNFSIRTELHEIYHFSIVRLPYLEHATFGLVNKSQ